MSNPRGLPHPQAALARSCRLLRERALIAAVLGVRLSTQQAAKFVPLAGQAVSAVLTYTALKAVCELHIQQCLAVAQQLNLPAPD